jgi:hypothetical protein
VFVVDEGRMEVSLSLLMKRMSEARLVAHALLDFAMQR